MTALPLFSIKGRYKSLTKLDAIALIAELKLERAADNRPIIIKPLRPTGTLFLMYCGKTSLASVKKPEAAPAAGDVVYIGEEDEKLSELLKKDYPEVEFKTDEHIHLGGLSVYSKKNGTISDRTFDFAIEEQRKEFAGRYSFA